MRFRYRLAYTKNELMRYTSNLDVHKSWERTFRRAKLPIAYSQGYHPQPKIQLACPLPLGFLSEDEILDFELNENLDIDEILNHLNGKMPPGFEIKTINETLEPQPSLQVQTIATQYRIEFLEEQSFEKLQIQSQQILDSTSILRERRGKKYDLRPLIEALSLLEEDHKPTLRMTLSARESATGRPEEVLDELGIPLNKTRITREKTVLNPAFNAGK